MLVFYLWGVSSNLGAGSPGFDAERALILGDESLGVTTQLFVRSASRRGDICFRGVCLCQRPCEVRHLHATLSSYICGGFNTPPGQSSHGTQFASHGRTLE